MAVRWVVVAGLAISLATAPLRAADPPDGDYLCRVRELAGIASTHIEGAAPPTAYSERSHTRFKMRVSVQDVAGANGKMTYRVVELPYSGPGHDTYQWQTPNAVLHSAYVGSADGGIASLTATEDQGFLRFAVSNPKTRALWFYHSGFQYAGGEDVGLAVRYGTCEVAK